MTPEYRDIENLNEKDRKLLFNHIILNFYYTFKSSKYQSITHQIIQSVVDDTLIKTDEGYVTADYDMIKGIIDYLIDEKIKFLEDKERQIKEEK